MFDKCDECYKENAKFYFKDLISDKKLCIRCAAKLAYKRGGIKSLFKFIKFHIHNLWIYSWSSKLLRLCIYIILFSAIITTIFSILYLLSIRQYYIIPSQIFTLAVAIYAVFIVWNN